MTSEPAFPSWAEPVLIKAVRFVRANVPAVLVVSALLLLPCFWHTHIQAGDLGSHIYNAWLAQLVERHQVSGLALGRQWNNVLFDLLVLHAANLFGFLAAEKIAVSVCVLTFFWGSFALIASVIRRPPWLVTPFLFMVSYGYAFEMGFMNYYFSVGLAGFALSAAWQGGAGNWLVALALGGMSLLAHPIGFALFAGVAIYVAVGRVVPDWIRLGALAAAAVVFVALRLYFQAHQNLEPSWRPEQTAWWGFLRLLGQDQINVYGRRYEVLSRFALGWGLVCGPAAVYDWIFRGKKAARAMQVAVELYAITVMGTFCLPENFRMSLYAGWVGLLASRLTLVTAVFGLAGLTSLPLPRWSWRGAMVIAAIFGVFLYQDTGKLDRMEANAHTFATKLPPGTRIVAVASAPDDWRVAFIYHSIDRACIGHCYSYANYEASSLQFRVRAVPGNTVVTTSVDQSDDMSSGDYIVRKSDLPLMSIYQCDDEDFTKLCALPLREGQKTEDPEAEPVPVSGTEPED